MDLDDCFPAHSILLGSKLEDSCLVPVLAKTLQRMHRAIKLLPAIILAATGGKIIDSDATVTAIGVKGTDVSEFILLGNRSYYGRFAAALGKNGFRLKPISVRAVVTEAESASRIIQYREAGGRYTLHLLIEHNYGYQCVFSRHHFVHVTMSLLDIRSNDTLLVIDQHGPNGKCPPLTPVWDLLAV